MKRFSSFVLALVAACWFLADSRSAQLLKVLRSGDVVMLSWPTQAIGYTLESSARLGPNAVWIKGSNAPFVVDDENVITQALTGAANFFRLQKAFGQSPAITNLNHEDTIPFGSSTAVSFEYRDPECDVAWLEITRSNLFGRITSQVAATALGATNLSGQVQLAFDSASLPFGPSDFTVRLRDRGGGVSATLAFTLMVTGASGGGTAPSIQNFSSLASFFPLVRPGGAFDRVLLPAEFSYSDPDADIERLRFRLTHPGGLEEWSEIAALRKGVTGSTGTVFTTLFAFRSTNALGNYALELSALDRNGNASMPVSISITLAAFGPLQGPHISGFSPPSGASGTVVTLTGNGFEAANPTNNRVTWGNVPVAATNATSTSMQVVIPAGAGSGKFALRTSFGSAMSADAFTVPPWVAILPASPEVIVNRREQFEVASAPSLRVSWKVNGIPGGDPVVGIISPDGLFTAPAQIPTGGAVTVSAELANNPAVNGQTTATILPPPLTRGVAEVFATSGGMVHSRDGRALVAIPPQALPTNASIVVEVLRGTNIPTQPGLQTLGAVEFGPAGLVFNQPVLITIPLARYFTPGTILPLRLFNRSNGTFTDESIAATVAANGEQATAQVSHFSTYTIAFPPVAGTFAPPIVTEILPAAAQEGLRVPVIIMGDELNGDLEPEILLNGVPSGHILPGTLHVLTNRAGVLLNIQTIRDLPEGQSRTYTLRLKRFGGASFVDVPFEVQGLDELGSLPGSSLVVTPAHNRRYSEVHVGGGETLVVAPTNGLDFEVTGPVKIEGNILANGAEGRPGVTFGDPEDGGPGGVGTQAGGAGGKGRDDHGCFEVGPLDFGFTSDDDCAEPENHGRDGNVVLPGLRFPEGLGGKPGFNISGLNVLEDFVTDSRNCILSGGSEGCVQLAADVWQITPETLDVVENYPVGQRGWPGVPGNGSVSGFGNGGGGGGGGGQFTAYFPISRSGNGGGAGGDGGRPIRILSADTISYDALLTTAGGNGGNGGTGLFGADFDDVLSGFGSKSTGGGGGGGSGGRLSLASAVGLVRGSNGLTSTEGGTNGLGGLQVRDESDFTIRTLVLRFTDERRAARGEFDRSSPDGYGTAGPVFMPTNPTNGLPETDHKVTQGNLLRVRLLDDVRFFSTPATLFITNDTNVISIIVPFNTNTFRFEKNVLLPNGANVLSVQAMHPLFEKRIVVLATDLDADGLSDLDEKDLGTNPADSDTDDDGLNDGSELVNESSPFDADTDDDGLLDFDELMRGTSPVLTDSDGDGFEDGVEVLLDSDPGDPLRRPQAISANLLFANSNGADGAFLTLIDPDSGAYGRLSRPHDGFDFGLAFDWVGDLQIARDDSLMIHDPFAFTNTIVGPFASLVHCHSLAYDYTNQVLLGVESGPAPGFPPTGQILQINLDNGIAMKLGVVIVPVEAMAFRADGVLFAALSSSPAASELHMINPLTGSTLFFIGPLGAGPITGLAFDASGRLHAARLLPNGETTMLTFDFATSATIPGPTIPRRVRVMAAPPFRLQLPLVSLRSNNDITANSGSGQPIISPDGTLMAYASRATDLVPQIDLNGADDVFVRDLTNDTTELVSVSPGGHTANGPSRPVQICVSNRFVLFTSTASDLVAVGLDARQDVFRRDLLLGTNELVSVAASGFDTGNGNSASLSPPSMSADGNFIVFESRANNLVALPPGMKADIFLRDMAAGITVAVDTRSLSPIPTFSAAPVISADGNVVAFTRDGYWAANRVTGVVTNIGAPASKTPTPASISTNGNRIVFVSTEPNLTTPSDLNGGPDIFLFDFTTGITSLLSVIPAGTAAGSPSPVVSGDDFLVGNPVISANGNFVAFESGATDLVSGSLVDTNDGPDIFLRDIAAGVTTLVSVSVTPTFGGTPVAANRPSFRPWISADGRRVFYFSRASNLVPQPHLNGAGGNVFVWDNVAKRTTRLSENANRTGSAGADFITGDRSFNLSSLGLTAVFTSSATNLARFPDRNGAADVFFRRLAR